MSPSRIIVRGYHKSLKGVEEWWNGVAELKEMWFWEGVDKGFDGGGNDWFFIVKMLV